jgi:hypothetical protein
VDSGEPKKHLIFSMKFVFEIFFNQQLKSKVFFVFQLYRFKNILYKKPPIKNNDFKN